MPLNMVRAGMLQRIFPDAKFIFIERDPRNCVISAFAQRFRVNDETANFLTLQKTAELYDRALTLWDVYEKALPLKVYRIRYEELIVDPEPPLRALIEFLEQDWRPEVLDHLSTVRKRKMVMTASYGQVSQALHTKSAERWRTFADQLAPVRPFLDKWVQKLGYPASAPAE